MDTMSGVVIVVGIDGSEGSRRALRWALEEGRLRGCVVEAVTAWPPRETSPEITEQQAADLRRHADELQRHVIDTVLREIDFPPTLSHQVVHGDPVDVLARLSSRAALLVVGSHGTDSLRHGGLGSVSEYCARLADCPVVVLPVPEAATGHDVIVSPPPSHPEEAHPPTGGDE